MFSQHKLRSWIRAQDRERDDMLISTVLAQADSTQATTARLFRFHRFSESYIRPNRRGSANKIFPLGKRRYTYCTSFIPSTESEVIAPYRLSRRQSRNVGPRLEWDRQKHLCKWNQESGQQSPVQGSEEMKQYKVNKRHEVILEY
jgi:hypothetical protein